MNHNKNFVKSLWFISLFSLIDNNVYKKLNYCIYYENNNTIFEETNFFVKKKKIKQNIYFRFKKIEYFKDKIE